MTDLRTAALDAAIRAHAHQLNAATGEAVAPAVIVAAAAAYLEFLAPGTVGQATADAGLQQAAAPKAAKAAKAAAKQAATPASAETQDASGLLPTAASAVTPTAAAAQPVATAKGPVEVPPPTTIQLAAESLKALVQDKSPGRGREVAVELLKEFGVEQLAQIPAPKLAEFKQRCDSAGKASPGAVAPADPTGGLLG